MFCDCEGKKCEVAVMFPWLPPRCTVCRRWGHKIQDCTGRDVTILQKQQEVKEPVEFATIPQVSKAVGGEGHSIEELIQDLEALTPHSIPVEPVRTTTPPTGQEIDEGQGSKSREESQGIQLSEPTTEVFHTNKEGRWETDNGRKKVLVMERKQREEKGIVISPSRFSPLQGIEEEEEEEYEEVGKEIE